MFKKAHPILQKWLTQAAKDSSEGKKPNKSYYCLKYPKPGFREVPKWVTYYIYILVMFLGCPFTFPKHNQDFGLFFPLSYPSQLVCPGYGCMNESYEQEIVRGIS